MSNLEKYKNAFKESFMVGDADLADLKYQCINAWDSVGHMGLMATLEDIFGIELDIDDIIDFSSFETGKAILQKKYNINLEA